VSLTDLIEELKRERAYVAISSAIEELLEGEDPLNQDNALEKGQSFIEAVDQIRRSTGRHSEIFIKADWEQHYERTKNLSLLNENGDIPGIPTGLDHLDMHWGGLRGESTYLYLGRPGDAKSFSLAQLAVEAAWRGYRAIVFSPEMTEHDHNCRFHTLLSAKPEVQETLNIREAFRNRALREGRGFNLKTYKRFLQWMADELPGEICLFTQKYRREKMTVPFIRSRIKDLDADLVIVDPVYKLRPPRRRGTRWEELSEITDGLVDLAHEFNIPVVLSNQANRALVGSKDDAPSLNSSYGSDTPVQEADVVIGVKHISEERTLRMRCTKNRYGERFAFKAQFHPNLGILKDVTPLRDEYNRGFDPEKLAQIEKELEEDDTYK
jgi:replicative DNA helicase